MGAALKTFYMTWKVYIMKNFYIDTDAETLGDVLLFVNKDMPTQLIFGEKTLKDIYFSDKYDLTHYDREIHDAIVSLYHQGHEYITPLSNTDESSQEALRVKCYKIRYKVITCLDFWKKNKLIKNYNNTTKVITISL